MIVLAYAALYCLAVGAALLSRAIGMLFGRIGWAAAQMGNHDYAV